MAKKNSNQELAFENEYLKGQVSGFNEYINTLEKEIEESTEYAESADEEIAALAEKNDLLQEVLVLAKHRNKELITENKLLRVVLHGVLGAVESANSRVSDLEQDNQHLTMQRDALKDKVQLLEERPIHVHPTQLRTNAISQYA